MQLKSSFCPLACIGRGKWGKVIVCNSNLPADEGKKLYAVKEIRLCNHRTLQLVQDERVIMTSLVAHPFIVQLHYALRRRQHVYFVMDFMPGGDLYTLLRKSNIRFKDTLFYATEIALALQHCHSQRVCHRDLKPENILVDERGHLKLADFGLAKILPLGCSGTHTLCGTEVYAAPEMLRRTSPYGFSVDVWQFGCFVYELFVGRSPFYQDNKDCTTGQPPQDIKGRILTADFSLPENLPLRPRQLMESLLYPDPSGRLGCPLGALSSPRPEAGWDDIRAHPFFEGVPWEAVLARNVRAPVVNVAPGEDVLDNFEEQFLYEDPEFSSSAYDDDENQQPIPCEDELMGFYFPGF